VERLFLSAVDPVNLKRSSPEYGEKNADRQRIRESGSPVVSPGRAILKRLFVEW
jgi:hypothetical protein